MSGNAVSMRFRTEQFSSGMKALSSNLKAMIDRSLFKTGVEMLSDFSNDAPKPPIDWGDLRGSGAVQVAGGSPMQGLVGSLSGPKTRKKRGDGILTPPAEDLKTGTVRVSFNTAYAAHLHESPDWKPNEASEQAEPGQIGYQWMRKKLEKYRAKYRDLLGEFIKDEIASQ